MTDKTRLYRKFYHEDYISINYRNSNKDAKRTAEQIIQSKEAKHKHYAEKWSNLLKEADTQAQRKYCKAILNFNDRILHR